MSLAVGNGPTGLETGFSPLQLLLQFMDLIFDDSVRLAVEHFVVC